jgi:hypothetical protein
MIDPHFAALVGGRGIGVISRQKPPALKCHPRDPPRNRHSVHVHVHRREKDAHLLPGTRRGGGGFRVAGHEHSPVRRRQDVVGRHRRATIRIAKEENEEGGKEHEDKSDPA